MIVAVITTATVCANSSDQPSRDQLDVVDLLCGPACVSLAAELVGKPISVGELLEIVPISEEGSSLADLGRAARELGLAAKGFKLASPTQLRTLGLDSPAIVQVDGNHFVLVAAENTRNLWMADYPKPPVTIRPEELAARWNPRILVISRRGSQTSPLIFNRTVIFATAILFVALLCCAALQFPPFRQKP